MKALITRQIAHNVVKHRSAAKAVLFVLVLSHLYLLSNEIRGALSRTPACSKWEQPISKLPRVSATHQPPREVFANSTSDITCAGIDVNGILHVKAAKTLDADINGFLNNSNNYLELGVPNSTWDDPQMRERWFNHNTVSLWRPLTKTYWTANRVIYSPADALTPLISYAHWEEWNEDVSQRVGSGKFPIFAPHHKWDWLLGPEDPRPFEDPYGHICFVFTMIDTDDLHKMWLYNTTSGNQIALHTPEGLDPPLYEKNWTPFVHEGQVKFVYTIQPLSIVACEFSNGTCEFDYTTTDTPSPSALHGGTNWVPWFDSGYYISIAHTKINDDEFGGIYRLSLVLLYPHSRGYKISYASGPLDFNNITFLEPFGELMNISQIDTHDVRHGRIISAHSIVRTDLFDKDSILVTVSTSDNTTALLEIGGISRAMELILAKGIGNRKYWQLDDGKAAECAERAASKHANNILMVKKNQAGVKEGEEEEERRESKKEEEEEEPRESKKEEEEEEPRELKKEEGEEEPRESKVKGGRWKAKEEDGSRQDGESNSKDTPQANMELT